MKSNWVKLEIADARHREEQEMKNLLFPITLAPMLEVKKWKLFDADRGIDSAREVREYFIPDFSGWDKDNRAYQTELGKLVRDLKAGKDWKSRSLASLVMTRPRDRRGYRGPSTALPAVASLGMTNQPQILRLRRQGRLRSG